MWLRHDSYYIHSLMLNAHVRFGRGDAAALPLPYESVVARAVFQRNHASVVRLRVSFVTGNARMALIASDVAPASSCSATPAKW